jgi:hypothetical protein
VLVLAALAICAVTAARLRNRISAQAPPPARPHEPPPRDPGLIPLTAKTHVSRILTKLDARDRAQLVVLAYESGLVVPGERGQ